MSYPIEVSETCYVEIEAWLEEYYETLPFRRIYKGGKLLGYQGFIDNFDLVIEEPISGVVEVAVIVKETGETKRVQAFDKWSGMLNTPELQGYLL